MLALLLLNPELELTQSEIAARVGASLTSAIDEIRRLELAGILVSRPLGRSRLVRAGNGRLVDALAELVLLAFGPVQIVHEEFGTAVDELSGVVSEVMLFGSYAARYSGEMGAAPADIDVLVVTDAGVDRDRLYAAADRAQILTGRPVNPTVITVDRWARRGSGDDPFVDEIASRPLVHLLPMKVAT